MSKNKIVFLHTQQQVREDACDEGCEMRGGAYSNHLHFFFFFFFTLQ